MRMTISLQSKIPANEIARQSLPLRTKAWRAALVAADISMLLLFGFQPLVAQAPASPPKSAAERKPVRHRTRSNASTPVITPAQTTFTPILPPPPIWPANDNPTQASVVWDSKGLLIEAKNSSLEQILKDFSTATGAKVEGLAADERVYGVYGPGQARDVLSQLLQGSSYNVMMVGDEGQGTPRRILLSARHAGDAHPAAAGNQPSAPADEEPEAEEPPPQQATPVPIRPGFAPGTPPRSPQQIRQEMEQRQQQQNQQPANPPN
jgi:hypothetical protein